MAKMCIDDNCYNITKQLSKKLEFLYHVNGYIEDAQKRRDDEATKTWKIIMADEERHAGMLKNLLALEAKNNRF